jgi:hypothetical protein
MSQTSGLTIRQHQRETIALRVEFVVADVHREQVRFSSLSSAVEPHVTRGTAMDVSAGGMGIICEQFIPRMCEGSVRVYDPRPVGTAPDGTPVYEIGFEHRVKVRRVSLASHDPTFAIGLAFLDPAPDLEQRVMRLLELATAASGGPGDQEGGADG